MKCARLVSLAPAAQINKSINLGRHSLISCPNKTCTDFEHDFSAGFNSPYYSASLVYE